MPNYYYKIKNQSGLSVVGSANADSAQELAEDLIDKKMTIIKISEKPIFSLSNWLKLALPQRIGSRDLVIFFRQLAVMLEANLPLVKALKILADQSNNSTLKKLTIDLAGEVEGGSSLSLAMSFHNNVFSNFYINIIKSGETSGRLSEVMNYLADQKERDYDLETKVRGAMIYPLFIFGVLVVVAVIVVVFIIPSISLVLRESGVALPLITRIMIGISDFFRSFFWLILIFLLALIIFLFYWKNSFEGARFFDRLKLKIPIFGLIFRNIYLVRFCLSASTLIKGGVPITSALSLSADVVDNVVYKNIINEAVKVVNEGGSLADGLRGNDYYVTPVALQMIFVGEESGNLEGVLDKVAIFYTREIDNTVKNLSTIIEPMMMVVLGLAVGLFVASVIMPMWQLSSAF